MIFRRHLTHSNYFLPTTGAETSKIFVFSRVNLADFSLEDALASKYTENYLLIFYKGNIDYSVKTTELLLEKLSSGSRIYWLDDFASQMISAASYIFFTNSAVGGFNNLGIGGNDPNVQLLHKAVKGKLTFDASKENLIIEPITGKFYEFSANGSDSNVKSLSISLTNNSAKIGKHSFSAANGLGSLNFQLNRKGILDLMQPISPYYLDGNNSSNARAIKVFYFDITSYNQNTDVYVSLKPFKNVPNTIDTYSSYMEVVCRANTSTNFADEKGRQFYVKKDQKTVCRVASVEYNKNDISTKRFFFIPQDGQQIELFQESNDSKKLLAGYSGTEAFSIVSGTAGTALTFRETDKVSLDKSDGILVKNGDSKTSLLELDKHIYDLDSERAPIFLNTELEPKYSFIERGKITGPISIPMIPTFSFKDSEDLKELEDVFRKIRLKEVTSKLKNKKLLSKSGLHITPQGFLKKDKDYDFILNETKKKNFKAPDVRASFQFNIVDNGADLDTSIRKDEVFFVLTPGLYKEYKSALLNAHFSINKSSKVDELFQLDLTTLFEEALTNEHSHSILIFKFNKKPLGDLLKDTTLWSNEGGVLNNQTSLKLVVDEITKGKLLEIDDTYFTENILRNPNWKGVVMLNVPIGSPENLPKIFSGLSNSQRLNKHDQNTKLALDTELNFKYVAFPENVTEIDGKKVSISSTSFYGMIDYNPFEDKNDYLKISNYFDNSNCKFVLSKLKVRFLNSKIDFFEAFSFLQVNELFNDTVKFEPLLLSHGNDGLKDEKPNLIRLKGGYQKNSDDEGCFTFNADLNGQIKFGADAILKQIALTRIGFRYDSGTKNYRFDLDASAVLGDWDLPELISIKKLDFSNIGLCFKFDQVKFPSLDFDLSHLGVLPDIDFSCNGFLSSFPIRFSHFKGFDLKLLAGGKLDINYDFFTLPNFQLPNIHINESTPFFSLVFDFDLGTLGNLAALKALKGQLLFGWSVGGGFAIGLKIAGPSTDGFHIDLFGALKLDIEKVEVCELNKHYMLRLIDARLTVLGMEMPAKTSAFNALLFAGTGNKLAWLMSCISGNDPDVTKNKLTLGIGQRVGIPDLSGISNVDDAMAAVKKIFDPKFDACQSRKFPNIYDPERNWLVGSENFIPDAWKDVFDLKFIFNDPDLYGVFLRIVGLFDIDILYKKVSESLGVWSLEFALDPSLRNIEMGGASVTLPNIGVDIYTNGDWRGDIGYPRSTSDWSRSCLIQIRPFVGWAGFYIAYLRNASVSLFAQYMSQLPKDPSNPASKPGSGVSIIQAGFAFRIGLGAYIDKGVFYVGASISVYGIMEGAFAFNKGNRGAKQLFPDHFALMGRVGAIAELIGYVDFKIVKAAVHVILRVEFGMLLALISGKMQPVPMFIEGEVRVKISVTITCFKVWRKKVCIVVHFSFQTSVRFSYTLGGDSQRLLAAKRKETRLLAGPINVNLGEVPVLYVPGLVKTGEKGNQLIHQFVINFFGCALDGDKVKYSKSNILKDQIIMPIIKAVLDKGITSYLAMREVFLEGPNGDATPFIVNSYTPTLYVGFDGVTDRNILKDKFLFTDDEVNSFFAINDCGIGSSACPYRIIPSPTISTLKVVHKNGTTFKTDAKGFKIETDGLFTDGTGNPLPINIEIKREEVYSDAHIATIEHYFDAYMTQFVDRSKSKSIAGKGLKDIREDAILPEYVKLIGLLAIETYYNYLTSLIANRIVPEFNPEIKLKEMFADSGDWIFNDHLDTIIGQLNYFYSNGLRIVDALHGKTSTNAYYEALKLNNPIAGIRAVPDPLADIKISKIGTTDSVSLRLDMFDGTGLADFVDTAKKNLNVDLTKLVKEFYAPVAEMPYELPEVKLTILNSTINTKEGATDLRFFEVPQRIRKHFNNSLTALNMFLVNNTDSTETELNFIPCINIEAKVKPHQVGTSTKVVELINVFIDDLTLMHKVKESGLRFDRISVYLKKTSKEGIVELLPLIKPGEEAKTRIVRTNLSPRTHPPIIIQQLLKSRKRFDGQYVASLSSQEAFIQLLWEALTTNNGGYHLVESPDSDWFSQMQSVVATEKVLEYSLVFSFESPVAKPFSGIHNYLKTENAGSLFSDLDASSHSLYVKVMKATLKKKLLQLEPLREYHSKLPAHCFSFTIERDLANQLAGHDKYLPVEFEIVGNPDITKDKVLPLMPLEHIDEATKLPIKSKLFYSHVTPLHKVADESNIGRYKNIGANFKLKFGLRDIYGFRAINLDNDLEYTHVYSDKLIPLSSWPQIECSYWLKNFKNNELVFELNIKAFHDGQVINEEEKKETRNALHTIIAQLTDPRVKVAINYINSTDLKTLFLSFLQHVLDNLDNPKVKKSKDVLFKIPVDKSFTKILNPVLTIARPSDDKLFVKVGSEVWDKELIRSVETGIVAVNVSERRVQTLDYITIRKDTLAPLNDAIIASGSPYVIGMGNNENNDKLIYLLRKDYIRGINYPASPLSRSKYFGITPYSNKLFSGKYKPVTAGAFEHNFSNIDLDKGLNQILTKIDALLAPKNIGALGVQDSSGVLYAQKLLAAKKVLVETELKTKTDNIDAHVLDQDQEKLRDEFRDILLDRLGNFYSYDGIIKMEAKVPANVLAELSKYRFVVGVEEHEKFNVVSSKLDFRSGQPNWTILFDQMGDSENIDLTFLPQITHVETDIDTMGGEIEKSNWIQLVAPVKLTSVVSTSHTDLLKKWPFIRREFLMSPVILEHKTAQLPRIGKLVWDKVNDLGKWQYELKLKDFYEPNDQLDFTINIKDNGTGKIINNQRNFKGFIAYWAAEMGRATYIDTYFIDDLSNQMNLNAAAKKDTKKAEKTYHFIFKKSSGGWTKDAKGIPFNIQHLQDLNNKTLTIILNGIGFDIFQLKERFTAVKPEIKALRNRRALNDAFVYVTDSVSPVSWAVPHINFDTAIKMGNGLNLQTVFDKIAETELPYKSTAMFMLNTTDVDMNRDKTVPMIPLMQMELAERGKPTVSPVDKLFDEVYKNGYPAISVTIYNDAGSDNNLPLFTASTIFKLAVVKKAKSFKKDIT